MTTAMGTLLAAWLAAALLGLLRCDMRNDAGDAVASALLVLLARLTGVWPLALLPVAGVTTRAILTVRRPAAPRQRQRGLLVIVGATAFVTTATIGYVTAAVVDERIPPEQIAILGSIAVPVAILLANLPWFLAQAERAAVEGVPAFASITLVLVAVSLSITLTTDRVAQLTAASWSVTLMVAVAVPLRPLLKRRVALALFGTQRAPHEILGRLGEQMSRAVPLDDLLDQLATLLRDHLGLAGAELWTGGGQFQLRAAQPASVPDETFVVPRSALFELSRGEALDESALTALGVPLPREGEQVRVVGAAHAGVIHGLIVARRDPGGAAFHPAEERVLAEVANVVGASLRNAALDVALQASMAELQEHAEELRRSRARVVATGDEVRRRLERDLHDGAQQTLAALAVSVGLARDLVAAGQGDDARRLLEELVDGVRIAMEEVRALAHGVYPPALASGGLVDALPSAAKRLGLEVDFRFRDVGRYAPPVEASVYFCCLEAVTNAAKHARGAAITLDLRGAPDRLAFEVRDDGPGFQLRGAPAHHGGLTNMADRTGSLGGQVVVDTAPGAGTTIRGWVPIDQPAAAEVVDGALT